VKKRILIVEDDPEIRQLLRYNLEREGYGVVTASDGEAGIDTARQEQPSLIVLDVMLPNRDGFDVCRVLKADSKTAGIPILMLTARSEDADIVSGLELGADDYVTKPFSPRVLVARIRTLLRRGKKVNEGTDESISVHGIEIQPHSHQVTVAGKPVQLSLTEFRILLALANKPGWVLSRSQLIDDARGEDCVVTDRTVDVHIVSLRKKLGKVGAVIETVRGVGYRMKAD